MKVDLNSEDFGDALLVLTHFANNPTMRMVEDSAKQAATERLRPRQYTPKRLGLMCWV